MTKSIWKTPPDRGEWRGDLHVVKGGLSHGFRDCTRGCPCRQCGAPGGLPCTTGRTGRDFRCRDSEIAYSEEMARVRDVRAKKP